MNNFANIPPEMRQFRQWICWQAEDDTKIPYQINGNLASVSDAATWSDFDSVVSAASNFSGIGFVFTQNDPFAGIDLDAKDNLTQEQIDRQRLILDEFDSYTEFSPSGKGLHIIVKGNVPHGRKRSNVEVYSAGRFFTMTGNVYLPKPISPQQDKLQLLWSQMGKARSEAIAIDQAQTQSDAEIIEAILSAANGDKAQALATGNWQDYYPSQSEADFALVDIIAYFTQNKDQIKRIFKSSALGQRDKANRGDYMEWMVNKAFDRQLPPIEIELNRDKITAMLEQRQERLLYAETQKAVYNGTSISPIDARGVSAVNTERGCEAAPPSQSSIQANGASYPTPAQKALATVNGTALEPVRDPYTLPPGLLGQIAQFIYAASPRPVKEVALATAIGLMAGICGRSYNVSATGLNLYTLLLAETGRGKEAMAGGIDRLMQAVIASGIPAATTFRGPADIMSGQALLKYLAENPCCLSLIGEFGYRLQAMAVAGASSADISLKRVLLDLYNKSGATATVQASIYSKKENNTAIIQAPAFSLLAESTPSTFFKALDDRLIEDGLMPRFIVIDYDGERVPLNKSHAETQPPKQLVDSVAQLCEMALKSATGSDGKRVTTNVLISPDAQGALDQFDMECDYHINNGNSQIKLHMWNRAHLNTMKLASLVAIGINPIIPTIEVGHVIWARAIVVNAIQKVLLRFEAGLAGSNVEANQQFIDVNKVIADYLTGDIIYSRKYGIGTDFFQHKYITLAYLQKKCCALASFKGDKRTPGKALKDVIETMLKMDVIRRVPPSQVAITCHGSRAECYILQDLSIIKNEYK